MGKVHNLPAHELLEGLDDDSASVIILDPPSAVGPPLETHDVALMTAVVELARVLKPGGAVVALGDARTLATWELVASWAQLELVSEMVVLWDGASHNSTLHTGIRWHMKPGRRDPAYKGAKVKSNVIVCAPVPAHHRTHPAQRPIELFNYLITLLTRHDDLVVDPFAGSGSALVAAALTERRWVGGDTDLTMCGIAQRRADNPEACILRPIRLWRRGASIKI